MPTSPAAYFCCLTVPYALFFVVSYGFRNKISVLNLNVIIKFKSFLTCFNCVPTDIFSRLLENAMAVNSTDAVSRSSVNLHELCGCCSTCSCVACRLDLEWHCREAVALSVNPFFIDHYRIVADRYDYFYKEFHEGVVPVLV